MTRAYDAIPLGSEEMDSDHCSNRSRELIGTKENSLRRERCVQDFRTSDVDLRVSKSKARLSMTSSMISCGRPSASMLSVRDRVCVCVLRLSSDASVASNSPAGYENFS